MTEDSPDTIEELTSEQKAELSIIIEAVESPRIIPFTKDGIPYRVYIEASA